MTYAPGNHVRLVVEAVSDALDEESGAITGHTIEPGGTVAHVIEVEEDGVLLLDFCCIGQWAVFPEDVELTSDPLTRHDVPDFHAKEVTDE